MHGSKPLLEIQGLYADYIMRRSVVKVLRGVDLTIYEGERLAIVGESGSGKTTLALIVSRLEPSNLRITSGRILYKGINLLELDNSGLRKLRQRDLSIIFQNPSESLNPLYTIGNQVIEALKASGNGGKEDLRNRALQLLRRVELPDPERILKSYPHELSGGQKQRVAIAIAIAKNSRLLIADEPTTALDVSVQARILDLLARVNKDLGVTQVLITHDIGVAYDFADRIAVMYGGMLVEVGRAREIIENPLHPYTRHLVESLPKGGNLPPGSMETLSYEIPMKGCPFAPRCPYMMPGICTSVTPRLRQAKNRMIACHAAQDLEVPRT